MVNEKKTRIIFYERFAQLFVMNEKQKAKIILNILNKIYPKAPVPLKSKNTFTLLISVLLSAQCTDVNVNNVTKNIYPKYFKPDHFVKLGRKRIEKLIKKIGIFRIKAKSIYLMSKQILEKHDGKIPKTFEELRWRLGRVCVPNQLRRLWRRVLSRFRWSVPLGSVTRRVT